MWRTCVGSHLITNSLMAKILSALPQVLNLVSHSVISGGGLSFVGITARIRPDEGETDTFCLFLHGEVGD